MQALSGTAAENLDADFVQDSWTLFARMRQEGPAREVVMIDEFAEPMTTTVLAELLGVPAADRDVFRSWARTLVGSGPSPEEVAAATEAVVTYSRELAEAKRAAPGDDLYSALVQAT